MALVFFKSLIKRIDRVLDIETKIEKKKRPYFTNIPAIILEKLSRRYNNSISKISDSKLRSNFFWRKSRIRINVIGIENNETSSSNNKSPESEFIEKDYYVKFFFALFSGPRLKKNDPT
jgi:hypothetical protein